jgi:hypothetical protein
VALFSDNAEVVLALLIAEVVIEFTNRSVSGIANIKNIDVSNITNTIKGNTNLQKRVADTLRVLVTIGLLASVILYYLK